MDTNTSNFSVENKISDSMPQQAHTLQNRKNTHSLILGVFVVFVIVLVGGMGYLLGNMNSSKGILITQPIISPTEVPTNTNPTAITQTPKNSNWKTYTDPNHHFQIQYPPSYNLSGQLATSLDTWKAGQGITLTNQNHPAKPTIFMEAVYDGYGPHFPTGDLNVSFQAGQLKPSIVKKSAEDYEFMIKEGLTLPNADLYTSSVVEYNNRPYSFRISHQAHGDTALENELLEILSTFKFTDTVSNNNAVFTSFDESLWEVDAMSNAQINSKENCYYIVVTKVGKIQSSLQAYIENQYKLPIKDLVDENTRYNQVWQGVESYNLKATGEGEVNMIYIRPGEDEIFQIGIYAQGNPREGYTCAPEAVGIPDILRAIRFY